MKLITKAQLEKLIANGKETARLEGDTNHKPVVKLFHPVGAATWLLTEVLPDDDTVAFGLCDLGMDAPELGYVSLDELKAVKGPLGLGVERDLHFEADKSISDYALEARRYGRIVA